MADFNKLLIGAAVGIGGLVMLQNRGSDGSGQDGSGDGSSDSSGGGSGDGSGQGDGSGESPDKADRPTLREKARDIKDACKTRSCAQAIKLVDVKVGGETTTVQCPDLCLDCCAAEKFLSGKIENDVFEAMMDKLVAGSLGNLRAFKINQLKDVLAGKGIGTGPSNGGSNSNNGG